MPVPTVTVRRKRPRELWRIARADTAKIPGMGRGCTPQHSLPLGGEVWGLS